MVSWHPTLALVPHAGAAYAAAARQSVFNHIKQTRNKENPVKFVYYLATIHARLGKEFEGAPHLYAQCADHDLQPPSPSDEQAAKQQQRKGTAVPRAIETEHSYKWVEPELRAAFPSAKHCVLFPYFPDGGADSSKAKQQLAKDLAFNSLPDTLILGTTDLTHYYDSEDIDGSFVWPQQLTKARREEPLIQSMVDANAAAVEQAMAISSRTAGPAVADAPHVLTLMARIAALLGLRGRVVDYYDSSSITGPLARFPRPTIDSLDRYTISWRPVATLVSYVGVVWEPKNILSPGLNRFDIMQALGAVRSVIALQTVTQKNLPAALWRAVLPSWSRWRAPDTTTSGVFVGTVVEQQSPLSDKDNHAAPKTNCSYGRFPDDPHTLADKIVSAASDCPRDAAERWRIPYSLRDLETFGLIRFKVELLQPEAEWTWIPATDLADTIDLASGHFGVKLVIPSVGSATFLPIVAQEWPTKRHRRRHPHNEGSGKGGRGAGSNDDMVVDYLDALSEKLGGQRGDWSRRPGAMVGIYQTTAFYWDPYQQTILSA